MRITEALMAEHVVFHNLFDHIERATPGLKSSGEIRTLAAVLEQMLELHSATEDKLLIEPLEPAFCQLGHEENFHAEHEQIEKDLKSIQETRKLATARKLLLHVVMLARNHFDKEERIVFPLAERELSSRSQELLGKRWAKQRDVTER